MRLRGEGAQNPSSNGKEPRKKKKFSERKREIELGQKLGNPV